MGVRRSPVLNGGDRDLAPLSQRQGDDRTRDLRAHAPVRPSSSISQEEGSNVPYTAEISRSNPTAFLFVVDQSGSMDEKMSSGKSKAQHVADVLNRTLATLIVKCTRSEGTRDYFDIGVLGYGADGAYNGFQGGLGTSILNPVSAIETSALRVEERPKKIDDGAGGLVERPVKFPIWFEPRANGGTPMCQAITKAAEELVAWCDAHPDSYPPTVLHITDGASTDGDPEELATQLRQIQTGDGAVLVFNLHVSANENSPIEFPASPTGLPDAYAELLFRMSSTLPAHLIEVATKDWGLTVSVESRGFMFNGNAEQIVKFFDIGTRPSQLR